MSSVLLQSKTEAISQAFQNAYEGAKLAGSDLHQFFQCNLDTLIDQGTQWGVNPVSAAVTGGSAATMAFSAWRAYHAFTNKVIGPSIGWGMLMGTGGWFLTQSAPQIFRINA